MSLDRAALARAVDAHGRMARVVVAEVAGSAPREVGAAMLVWEGGQSGTIGGGTLEYEAAWRALSAPGLTRHALGPDLGQCCGGRVTLLCEHVDADTLAAIPEDGLFARGPGEMPLSVRRLLAEARGQGVMPPARLVDGWMVEPVVRAERPLWIWGAGHVGRAIVDVLAPCPGFALSWADTAPARFPGHVPAHVTPLPAADLPRLAAHAPREAAHLILTYSHEIDLALCHALLQRGFGFAGLIGSETKWARFRKRLAALGHDSAEIGRICCPIGQKSLGKHPQAIALGVATQLLQWDSAREGAVWDNRCSASGA